MLSVILCAYCVFRIVDKYSQHFEKAMQNTEHTLGNPIDAFLLIKRFTVDYERDVSPILGNDSWKSMFSIMLFLLSFSFCGIVINCVTTHVYYCPL